MSTDVESERFGAGKTKLLKEVDLNLRLRGGCCCLLLCMCRCRSGQSQSQSIAGGRNAIF